MKNKTNKKNKKTKIKDDDLICLYYDLSTYIIPRLRKFSEITISYPFDETPQSWAWKLNFIADTLEERCSDNFYNLSYKEMTEVREKAQKAAKMLGEVWFDLWS